MLLLVPIFLIVWYPVFQLQFLETAAVLNETSLSTAIQRSKAVIQGDNGRICRISNSGIKLIMLQLSPQGIPFRNYFFSDTRIREPVDCIWNILAWRALTSKNEGERKSGKEKKGKRQAD